MWNAKKVEQALFRWPNWRQSIVAQWTCLEVDLQQMPIDEAEDVARQQIRGLDLPASRWLEIYWVCSTTSDYSLDNEDSFSNITLPQWLAPAELPSDYTLKPGTRMYPPAVASEKDLEPFSRQYPWASIDSLSHPKETEYYIYTSSGHEFYSVLETLRGRPKRRSGKRGRIPVYSDRLAVECAVYKDRLNLTYLEIADRLELP